MDQLHQEPETSEALADEVRNYWNHRKNFRYLHYVVGLVRALEPAATSAIDVGARGTPIIEAFPWMAKRLTLDIQAPYSSPNVEGIKADFFDYRTREKFDLALCLQVLEHIPDAERFAQKLFSIADRVVISVPYKWSPTACKHHVHDPVDFDKLRLWTRRQPLAAVVIGERDGAKRAVAYYRASPLSPPERGRLEALTARIGKI
ncbi:hypothetical protein IZ6_24510 [Terrihabitans soli]|uniref:Class I SAM-dependent methyltransferase n=1 Tax=Terrihabitans soli TaxID=708113 RepID=A0A6S6QQA9_9HYPH|nr:hypothetical protein [Terrihabitans soli]BCJ91716.1 hypothetical protein IZ6_24510 [Terrihabitans soli]